MVLSGRTMLHALPKRPVTSAVPPAPRPQPAASSSRSQAHSAAPAHHTHHQSLPPQPSVQTTNTSLSSTSEVFLSQISLPERPLITYRQFGPVDGVRDPHLAVELVRRWLVKDWEAKGILDTFLTVVRVDKLSVSLWVFVVGSEGAAPGEASLDSLHFEEMHAVRNGSFTPQDLFPCSPDCTHPTKACLQCSEERPRIQNNIPSSCLLPRTSLRVPYAAFLDAVRDRLIDKVSQQQYARPHKDGESSITKLLDGFVLGCQDSGSHWSNGWDFEARSLPNKLVHCYLHISLLSTRLLVQPLFRKIPMVALGSDVSPGAPIVMLPYGTPAHYIGPYVGPVREQEQAFQKSLGGLGCRNWAVEGFVVCWITVRNHATAQQGGSAPSSPFEERGLVAVWPRALCLLSTSPSRQPLTSIPSIPASVCPPVSPPRPTPSAPSAQKEAIPQATVQAASAPVPVVPPPVAPAHIVPEGRPAHTPVSSLEALKLLTIDGGILKYGFGFEHVASEMTSYVDWVVKEREREKERLAKEKEKLRKDERLNASSGPSAGRPAATSSSGQISTSTTSLMSRLPLSTSSHHRPQGSAANPQGYYPSPPEANSPSASISDALRSGVDVSPQVTLEMLREGEGLQEPAMDGMLGGPPHGTNADAYLTGSAHASNQAAPQLNSNADVTMASRQASPDDANPFLPTPSAFTMDAAMGIGMEDVTEDDFSFFDVAKDMQMTAFQPSNPNDPFQHLISEPLQGVTRSDPFGLDPSISFGAHNLRPTSIEPNTAALNGFIHSSSINVRNDTSHTHDAIHPDPSLPMSPAKTPSSSPSLRTSTPLLPPSPDSEDAQSVPPLEELAQAPEFPYRTKEYVAATYSPIPVPVASVITDLKYKRHDGKYWFPLSSVSSPSLAPASTELPPEEDVALLPNDFIGNTIQSQHLSPAPLSLPLPLRRIASRLLDYRIPSSEDAAALESQRFKQRLESRRVRELPSPSDRFEVWHSKKFVHKFTTTTDPRVQHIMRLSGLKRNLIWNPYPYLRTEGDGDTRSIWRTWEDFADIVPARDGGLPPEDALSDDGDTETSPGSVSDDDTVTTGDGETPEDVTEGTPDQKANGSEGDKHSAADRFRTPPPPAAATTLLGASLLQTLFYPHHIFPLANSQTAPNVPATTAVPPPGPMSVPTPVSPAAHFVHAGEGAALLEAAADVITREVVENPVWAESSRAVFGWTDSEPVNATEVDFVADIFQSLPSMESQTSMQNISKITECPSYAPNYKTLIAVTKPPLLAVGQASEVLHLSAPSLRFWEKLGLLPLSGTKDVVAFALYEEDFTPSDYVDTFSRWFEKVALIYKARGFGTHKVCKTLGQHPEGLVPFKWENIKKTLLGLISSLPSDESHIVLYIVSAPSATLTTSKEFRQMSSIITNSQSSVLGLDGRVLFHFVPRSLVFQSIELSETKHVGLEHFVSSVYDRLLRKIHRNVPRQIFKHQMMRTHRFIQAPSFMLARETSRFSFLLVDWPPASENAADRHSLLHVAYQLSTGLDWLFISGIDERGEGHRLKAWYLGASESEDEVYDKVTSRVMTFAWDFASQSSTEWSVVIARSGSMVESELIAWEKCLHREVISQDVPMHVTIACVENETSLAVLPSSQDGRGSVALPVGGAKEKTSFQDMASTAYIMIPWHRTPLIAQNAHWMGPKTLAMDLETDPTHSPYGSIPRPPQFGLLPLASAYILHAPSSSNYAVSISSGSDAFPASMSSIQLHILRTGGSPTSSLRKPLQAHLKDIAKNYWGLAVLARERWGISSFGVIPFHLAAVEIMRRVVTYTRDV